MTGATVNAGAATATLNGSTSGTLIDLGGADTANTLGLTDAELDGITAGSLRIGDFNSGRISFTRRDHAGRNEPVGADDRRRHYGRQRPYRR